MKHNIFLVGFMASGKSYIAAALAEITEREAVDLDTVIEEKAGTTIAQIFKEQGEAAFRDLETATLKEFLEEEFSEPKIVATGGGIVMREENRQLMKQAAARGVAIVYLKADAGVIATRIRRQPGVRPIIDGDGLLNLEETQKRVESLLKMRGPLYDEVASLAVDSAVGTPHEIAQNIELALKAS